MNPTTFESEYVLLDDGSEVCAECGHIWTEDGTGHYHDCRYFSLEDGETFDEGDEELPQEAQLSLFRPAA